MNRNVAITIAALLTGSLYSCKKETAVNLVPSAEKIKEVNACSGVPAFLGVRTVGGPENDEIRSISVASTGDITVTGVFQGTVDFDQSSNVLNLNAPVNINGLSTTFSQTSTAAGNFLSAENTGPEQYKEPYYDLYAPVFDAQGNKYVPGFGYDPLVGATQFTVTKVNAAGQTIGKITVEYLNGLSDGNQIYPAKDGYIYILTQTGAFYKYKPSGKLLWKKFAGLGNSQVLTDNFGNVYVAAHLTASVRKYNSNGDQLWEVFIGKNLNTTNVKTIIDNAGNLYKTGTFLSNIDFDPGEGVAMLTASNGSNAYIQKLSPDGKLVWVVQTKNNSHVNDIRPLDIVLDATGTNVYVTGYYKGTVNFNTEGGTTLAQSNGKTDAFVMRLRQCN